MASPSSLSSRNWSYNVFASFHGPDVRKTLLSHIRKQFNYNGITMFDDQGIERSEEIAPSLKKAIRQSRISIVILSKKYASSSWCLDELVEILECKKAMGQIVMTIFYGVDPSDVRKQIGEFGIALDKTCARKTDEETQKWSKALNEVGNIAGEDFLSWNNEAKMIEKIAIDVSNKLNATPSRDFDGMVGLEAHLREMESLLDLDNDGVKMVGIYGPAGIGKTTIARALHSQISNRFQLTCFVDNLRGSYLSGLDELRLQEQFLSKVLNQDGIRICHSGVIEERLSKQKVLIILDDVNHIKQLEALVNETTWFGFGSRIVVTTENKELLQQHGINNIYHVRFPSDEQAAKILCRYAFRKNTLCHGFEKLVLRVTKHCGNLPLGLRVVGSSLRGKNEEDWEEVIHRLETILDHQDIEEVLKVGYESLHENEQYIFFHIAVFLNYKDGDLVKAMFADKNLDIKHGLKILENKSLIYISTEGKIVMHKLLQQVGTKAVHKDPWKHHILIDSSEICDVLEHAEGTRAVSGISFDICDIDEISISEKAFRRMPNLRFLRVYNSRYDGNDIMHIPEHMAFPSRLRLLNWELYPSKSLPLRFCAENLVELNMQQSKLEYLWQGTQPLKNLKNMDLSWSFYLKELPDLSNATNLENLNMIGCQTLIEIPSSFSHLHKLQHLLMSRCRNLQIIPADMNLASLEDVGMTGCSRLRNIPAMSTNIQQLYISETAVEDVPPTISLCSQLYYLHITCKEITHLPTSLEYLDLSYSKIQKIPDCIKALHCLQELYISGCKGLVSLPELPRSLELLEAEECESLETVFCPLNTPNAYLNLINCFKLGQQARKAIIQQPLGHQKALLPGREVPAEFDHRAEGNLLTIHLDGNRSYSGFVVCVVISPNHQIIEGSSSKLLWRRIIPNDGYPMDGFVEVDNVSTCRTEHLFIFHFRFQELYPSEDSREIKLKFSSESGHFDVIECGANIIEGSYKSGSDQAFEDYLELFTSEEVFEEDDTEYNQLQQTLAGPSFPHY